MKPAKKITLSKSSFIRGLQCPKSLYLYKYSYSLRDKLSPEILSKFSRGHHIGLLAQQLFPDGINMKPFSPQQFAHAAERTKEKILQGANTIYEAAFTFNDVTVFLDILHFADGCWHAYEVKSSAEVSETFIMDASLQNYVIENSGIDLASFKLIYLNKDYLRKEKLDITELFSFRDVSAEVKNNLPFIQDKVGEFKALLGKSEVPEIRIGTQCNDPYTCDFIGHCWKDVLKQTTVFSIPAFSEEEKFSLYHKGVVSLENMPAEIKLNEIQELQIESSKAGSEYFNEDALKKYFSFVRFPVLLAEMLSCRAAVPPRKNSCPYQHIPFMLHASSLNDKGGEINPVVFSQEDILNNTLDFYNNISAVFEDAECVLVFGKGRFLQSLQTLATDGFLKQSQFKTIENKILDLKDVFLENIYFNPALSGNYDLQSIARTIFKIRISRNLISSHVIASDIYDSLQSETDMFHIVEIKEKLNEFAAFNLDVMKKYSIFCLQKLAIDLPFC